MPWPATTPTAALDPTFSGDGKLIIDFGGSRNPLNALVLQPDGKLVVAGFTDVIDFGEFALARLLPNGTLDPTFDGDGKGDHRLWW